MNLDDITKTSFCIPFKKPAKKPDATYSSHFPSTPYSSRDLPFPQGNDLRLKAYHVAWGKCLERMRELVTNLQKSTIDEVSKLVVDSDSATTRLPGLPFPELSVTTVINPTFGPSLLHRIITELEGLNTSIDAMDTDMDDDFASQPCLVVHFRAVDFPNVTAGMRAIVGGFLDKAKENGLAERRATPAASLAGYNIKYLQAWYRSLTASKEKVPIKLVVMLHDFEQFEPSVMQDIFYICSRTSSLPLAFILSLTSPLPDFLNTVYSASTLSLMRVRTVRALGGEKVLSGVLRKTFFDVDFDPDIVIGPSVLELLQDLFTRHHSTIDVILTVLQLAHLKHFMSDPLTTLVYSTPSTQHLRKLDSTNFLNSLRTRLELGSSPKSARNDEALSVATIIEAINNARGDFRSKARDMRVGFGVMCIFQAELRKLGYKGLEWASEGESDASVDVMIDLLRGRLGRDIRQLGTITKKLKLVELESVLDRLNTYFFELPAHARTEEQEARTQLTLLRTRVSQDSREDVAEAFSEWLKEYLSDKLHPLEELELWDVWYTRNTPAPSELLNPSVRASIVAGLLRPYEYTEFSTTAGASESASGTRNEDKSQFKGRAIWELSDTSILFRRYLDSGKMINVFDWFESFKGVLEVQRKEVSRSPRKGKSKEKKSKGKGKEEAEDEEWRLEVQARFVRALHELDYLGFVKHTGRKRDHVLRTLFEVGDDEG